MWFFGVFLQLNNINLIDYFIFMWGAIIGAGISVAGNLFAQNKAERAARRAQEAQEKAIAQQRIDNQNRLRSEQAASRAMYEMTLSQNAETMRKALEESYAKEQVMGGDGRETARVAQAAGKNLVQAQNTAAMAQLQSNKAANTNYYTQNMALTNASGQAAAGYYNNMAQSASAAGQAFGSLGSSLLQADLEGHLKNGQGLFETIFSKKKEDA